MKKFTPFTTGPGSGAKPLTWEQAKTFLTEAEVVVGQKRGHLKTFGPWQIPVSYSALAISVTIISGCQ